MAMDVFSFGVFGAIANQQCMNVFHFRGDADTSPNPDADAADLIDAWEAYPGPLYIAALPSDYKMLGLRARRVNNGGGPSVSQVIVNTNGTRAGLVSTSGIGPCMVWGYFTGVRWRAGRTFMPGVSEDDIEENGINAGLLAALQAFGVQMLTPMVGALHTWEAVIWQRTALTSSGIETATVSGKPGVQNRRMKPTF